MLYVYICYHLQDENIARLTGPVLSVAQRHGALQADAQVVNETFQKRLTLFSKCHKAYSRSCSMTNTDIDQFSKFNLVITCTYKFPNSYMTQLYILIIYSMVGRSIADISD